jgi:hypothetical protein
MAVLVPSRHLSAHRISADIENGQRAQRYDRHDHELQGSPPRKTEIRSAIAITKSERHGDDDGGHRGRKPRFGAAVKSAMS